MKNKSDHDIREKNKKKNIPTGHDNSGIPQKEVGIKGKPSEGKPATEGDILNENPAR